MIAPPELQPYVEGLRALPFVRAVRVSRSGGGSDYELELKTDEGSHRVRVEHEKSHLSRALAELVVAGRRRGQKNTGSRIVFAPLVGRELGDLFERERVAFMDLAGNCYLDLDGRYLARVQGRKPVETAPTGKGLRAPAYRALFALLAEPALAGTSVRTLAEAAGVSRQAALDIRQRLLDLGILRQTQKAIRWVPGRERNVVDMFVNGYFTTLRPRLVLGRFRISDPDVTTLETLLVPVVRECDGRWGGGAAAYRLTGHYRGEHTILHLHDVPRNFGRQVRAIPDRTGPLELIAFPGPVAAKGATEDTAHPLLVYSELLVEGSERAREAAAEIAERWLGPERFQ